MIQAIYIYGSDVLRRPAEPVDLKDKAGIAALVQDLKDTLAKAEGCGLAAPQIGVSKRVVIVDGREMAETYPYLKDFTRTLINPTVVEESSEKCSYSEGCLSIPQVYADVTRPARITVEYYDEALQPVREEFDKFACRMVQHELSHLEGELFTDRVAPIRKKIIAKKLQNIARGKVSAHYNVKLK